jgi:hypothetical protein
MTKDTRPILTRLRRKLDVLFLDFQRENSNRYHDVAEMLALLDLLEGRR